jgi:hypothetical protein
MLNFLKSWSNFKVTRLKIMVPLDLKVIGNDLNENVVLCGIKSIDTHGIIVVSFYNLKRNISGGRANVIFKIGEEKLRISCRHFHFDER